MNKDKFFDDIAKDLFANDPNWKINCINNDNSLNINNLPAHLNDDLWLAKMFKKDIRASIYKISDILNYVQTSPYFASLRHEYELEIVRNQIIYIEEKVIYKGYEENFFSLNDNCDLIFREAIIRILQSIGLDLEIIEEGIEKYAFLWRKNYMLRAFHNQNYANFTMEECTTEYQEMWLQLREYEYYQQHKNMVDKYGTKTDSMLMNKQEAQDLKNKVLAAQNERKLYIQQIKKEIQEGIRENSFQFKIEEPKEKPISFSFTEIMEKPVDESNPIILEIKERKRLKISDRIKKFLDF